jgi:opacity protein-like surface antigen
MVKTNQITCWAVILGLFISSITGQAAAADLSRGYFALYGGLTIPESLQHARGIGTPLLVEFTDLDLVRSAIVGAKVGIRFPGRDRWAGLETEFFYTNPHVKQQDVTSTIPALPFSSTDPFPGAHMRVATWAVNWMVRYPGEVFQPYIGVGPGVFWGRISGNDVNAAGNNFGTGSDTSLGLNVLAGTRILLTQRLAVFGEYKYNRVTFDFGGTAALHVLYQPHHFVGGLSLLF